MLQPIERPTDEPRLISVNLIFDYPVRWNKFKVLRDLVQNFYDAVGHQEWCQRFTHEVRGSKLYLSVAGVAFSYEWLVPIGASTKRDKPGETAGYFGEGFKIASLCAVRDHGWEVEMASRDWQLRVTTTRTRVDGRDLKSLAYEMWENRDERADTILCLDPFPAEDSSILESVLLSFYYDTNPLLGKRIWGGPKGAVYHRSSRSKPYWYPATSGRRGDGIIFAGYQALGSFSYPLVVCLHHYHSNDRERRTLYDMDVVNLIREFVGFVPSSVAGELLDIFNGLWYQYPTKRYDFDCWYGIIKELATNLARSSDVSQKWTAKHPNLVVCKQAQRTDIPAINLRHQALAWMRATGTKYRRVQDGFLCLGYPTLEEVCKENDGFTQIRDPAGIEIQMIALLQDITVRVFGDFFGTDRLPPCKIVKSRRSAWMGMAECKPLEQPVVNRADLKIRARLPYVALKSYLFNPYLASEALSTYLHEMAHVFGGDQSAGFSRALTTMLSEVARHAALVQSFIEEWDRVAAAGDPSLSGD